MLLFREAGEPKLYLIHTSFCDWPVFHLCSRSSEAAIQDASPSRLMARPVRSPSGVRTKQIIKLRLMNIFNGNEEVDRAISNGKLHTLLCFHTRPIDVVVFHGSDREHSFSGWFPA